jgi:hypothetical protein
VKFTEGVHNSTTGDDWKESVTIDTSYRSPPSEFNKRSIQIEHIDNLKPDTFYTISVSKYDWSRNELSHETKYFTYKTPNTRDLKIVAGSDVGNSEYSYDMIDFISSKVNPDVIMIGGNAAFDHNSDSCNRAWDYLLKKLPISIKDTESGTTRLYPVMIAYGREEFGRDPFSRAIIEPDMHGPLFQHYFYQNTKEGKFVDVDNRMSFFAQNFNDKILILNLDTGYGHEMKGLQADWIEEQLSKSKATIKLVQYHNPIYSVCEQDKVNNQLVIDEGLRHWIPLFDKYHVTAVLENSSRIFKRSKILKNGKVDTRGTTYLGEGYWGTKNKYDCKETNVDLHEKISFYHHVWVLHIDHKKGIEAKALNSWGDEIDSVFIKY